MVRSGSHEKVHQMFSNGKGTPPAHQLLESPFFEDPRSSQTPFLEDLRSSQTLFFEDLRSSQTPLRQNAALQTVAFRRAMFSHAPDILPVAPVGAPAPARSLMASQAPDVVRRTLRPVAYRNLGEPQRQGEVEGLWPLLLRSYGASQFEDLRSSSTPVFQTVVNLA
jgi:hypothetical protein